MDALLGLDALTLSEKVRAREVSATEVIEASIARINALNPAINAVCTLAEQSAIDAARVLDAKIARGEEVGPLAGIPVGIKDVILTGGIRTTFGSPRFADFVPEEDAESVARLKRAGAIVIGKTNTPEFAAGGSTINRVFGASRNPWNTERSPGGSTGGGAAGLAARMFTLALGTDLGGSLRLPAAFCGVVGIRPTPGRVPAMPVPVADDPWQVDGPITRTALDTAVMLDALSGFSPRCPISVSAPPVLESARSFDLRGRRLAYCPDVARIGVDPEIVRVCEEAVSELAAAGAVIEPVDLDLSPGRQAFLAMRGHWMLGQHFERLDDLDGFGENVQNNVRLGLEVTARDLAAADRTRTDNWRRLDQILRRCDAMLTPCVPVEPFPAEQNYPTEIAGQPMQTYIDWLAPTFLFSMLQVPAASVPAGLTASGLPVGLQIVTPRFQEGLALGIANVVERIRPIGRPNLAA